MTSGLWSDLNDEIEGKLQTYKTDHPDPKTLTRLTTHAHEFMDSEIDLEIRVLEEMSPYIQSINIREHKSII